jgi:hypothetical protein
MQAYKISEIGDGIALTFTKVIDELQLGEDDSAVIVRGTTTRGDYEGAVPKAILEMVDAVYEILRGLAPEYELNYTRSYIGLARSGAVNNFLQFRPKQNFLKLTFKCAQSPELEGKMEAAGIDVMRYDQKWREYTIRITPKDFEANRSLLGDIVQTAYQFNNAE